VSYVDGYLLPLPKKNLKAYTKMATWGHKTWTKHGAVDYKECVIDDVTVPCGMPFPKLLKVKKDEVVVYAFVVFKSRAHRDRVNRAVMKAMMADKKAMPAKMPFDPKRMVYSGFKTIVE
jgi:uncharacterized protein YbaA (DUF1428 family)